jgi:hypothetical protein
LNASMALSFLLAYADAALLFDNGAVLSSLQVCGCVLKAPQTCSMRGMFIKADEAAESNRRWHAAGGCSHPSKLRIAWPVKDVPTQS